MASLSFLFKWPSWKSVTDPVLAATDSRLVCTGVDDDRLLFHSSERHDDILLVGAVQRLFVGLGCFTDSP